MQQSPSSEANSSWAGQDIPASYGIKRIITDSYYAPHESKLHPPTLLPQDPF
jgi:hypothetical protein